MHESKKRDVAICTVSIFLLVVFLCFLGQSICPERAWAEPPAGKKASLHETGSVRLAENNESEGEKKEKGGIQSATKEEKGDRGAGVKGRGSESEDVVITKDDGTDMYLIGPEDVLEISVWKDENLSKQVIVRPDGKISLPLIGDIQAGGKTTNEVSEEITEKLKNFIPEPTVTVTVASIHSFKIYIIGNISRSGEFSLGRQINVLQALAMAGGLGEFASSKKIMIIRKKGKKQVKIPFNYKEVLEGENIEQNIYLQRGDVIVVP